METMGERLRDSTGRLSAGERARIERALDQASERVGSPFGVDLVPKVGNTTLAAFARRAFDERQLDTAKSDPVLLVIALREKAAAIETGKGIAGIVPELDARPIVRALVRRLGGRELSGAIVQAIDAMTTSALATAERRRPLPPEPDESSDADADNADDQSTGADATAIDGARSPDAGAESAAASHDTDGGAAGSTELGRANDGAPAQPRRRSRQPIAWAIAALVLLALALRQRKRLSARRRDDKAPPRPGRKG